MTEENTQIIDTWDQLPIPPELLRGIFSYGFEMPSPIQQKAILPILMKKDIIAQAQSGTGKTATFAIGTLANINITEITTQALILSPTKELTIQTAKVFENIGCFMRGLNVMTLYGGQDINYSSTPHIICGCVGRVLDMTMRGKIKLNNVRILVLDEADVMLSSVFKEQVHSIFDYLHRDVKIALFTATLPAYMQPLLNKIMQDPVIIQVKPEALTLDGIRQYYLSVNNDKDKFEQLKDLFRHLSLSQTIIYCNSVKRVEDLYNSMNIEGYAVSMIHSNMTPDMRKKNFSDFKEGNTRVLISTDVTARGIDIQQVSIVINYDLPKCVHKYLHRIGRSGRWGRKGVGINFVTYHDQHKMQELEYFYQIKIKVLPENFGITL